MPERNIMLKLEEKWCKKGRHIVNRSNFAKDKTKSDGLSSACKDCIRLKNEDYYKRNKKEKWGVQTNNEKDAEILRHMTRFINNADAQIIAFRNNLRLFRDNETYMS